MRRQPIRVALFFTTLELGGTERQALNLIAGLDRKRVVPLVYSIKGGSLESTFKKLRVPVRIFENENKNLFAAPAHVRTWLRTDRIDILHALLWHTNIIARFACRGTSVKCINSVRWAERRARDILDYVTRSRVDWWIANSEYGAKLARLPKEKTTIIRNGIDEKLLATPLSAWKPRPKTVTMVAQFRREKRYDIFIQAAAKLPDWTFQCVGDGENLEAMKSFADRLGATNVQFLGKRSDVKNILLRSRVAVLLSTSEGSPNAALEALALGVPFIGSDIPAHRELLDSNMERVRDADSLVRLLRSNGLSGRAERSRLQSRIRDQFQNGRMVSDTVAVWSTLQS